MSELALEVWGDYACFTRPESKVERLSYLVITPSAARAIFDSIYICFDGAKIPTTLFYWQIKRVEILAPIQFIPFTRSEVKGRAKILNNGLPPKPLVADGMGGIHKETGRTQRQSMILRKVRYRIFAQPVLYTKNLALEKKIHRIFERRAKIGQCYHQPYLGCREFVAYFELIPAVYGAGIPIDEEIGIMLYDVFDLSNPSNIQSQPSISIFRGSFRHGVLEVPDFSSADVIKTQLEIF